MTIGTERKEDNMLTLGNCSLFLDATADETANTALWQEDRVMQMLLE